MIRVLIAILICLLTAGPSWAAISFSAVTNNTPAVGGLTDTTSVTVASCTQCILLACSVNGGTAAVEAQSIVFNTSESFVKKIVANRTNSGVENVAAIWVLVNPSVTTANVVTTYAATGSTDRSGIAVSFLLYQGVDQTTPTEATGTNTGTGTTLTASLDTLSTNAWVNDCAIGDQNAGLTVDSAQTMRVDRAFSTADGQGASDIAVVSPGTQVMTWTQITEDWAHVSVALKPYVAAAAATSGNSGACILLGVTGC